MTASGWKNRIVGSGVAKASDLSPNPLNWRQHPSMQRAAMLGALVDVGWVQQVIVNRTTGNLIDGHLRVELAKAKDEEVPFVEVELTEAEERLVLATLDPLAAMATPDQDALNALLASVASSEADLQDLLDSLGSSVEIDDTYQPESSASGLSQLLVFAPTEDIEYVRAVLIAHADTIKASGGIDERMGRAMVAIVRAWEKSSR